MTAVTWIVMAAAGWGSMWVMRFTPGWVDFVLVRFAAACFVGVGVVGVNGWIGDLFRAVLTGIVRFVDLFSTRAVGNAVVWIVVLGICLMWLGALLPGKVFSYDFPDWLLFIGVALPILAGNLPGALGSGLNDVITSIGGMAIDATRTVLT